MGWFTYSPFRGSNGGDNWVQGMGHDIAHQSTNPRGVMTGGSNFWNQWGSQHRWLGDKNDASTKDYNLRVAHEEAGRQGQYDERVNLLKQYQGEDDAARTGALGAIDAAYGPQRQQGYEQAYQARLGDALAGVNAQARGQSQQASLAAAGRGRLGSSSDAEQQTRIAHQQRMGAMGAENDAADYSKGLSDTDYAQMQALRRSILSGDAQSAAAYQGMAASANGQTSALAGQSALADRQRLLSQAYGNAQSQQLGGFGNAIAGGVQSQYGVYGRG